MKGARRPPRLLLVTGMSGAGKSTVLDALEDMGWDVVDNLPTDLLGGFVHGGSECRTVPAAVGDASRVAGGETPPVRPAETPALRAKTLKSVTTSGSGPTLSVQLAADGDVVYNAFSLEKPSRLVIDLNDVTDKVAKGAIDVNGAVVKKVRVAQFKGGAEPVTRVVVDLAAKSPYKVTKDGDRLVVTFGGSEGQAGWRLDSERFRAAPGPTGGSGAT